MDINRIIWFDDIVDKLERKHGVGKSEVWELLQSKPKFRFVEKGHREGENVYAALGGGKILGRLFHLQGGKRCPGHFGPRYDAG